MGQVVRLLHPLRNVWRRIRAIDHPVLFYPRFDPFEGRVSIRPASIDQKGNARNDIGSRWTILRRDRRLLPGRFGWEFFWRVRTERIRDRKTKTPRARAGLGIAEIEPRC